MQLLLQVRQQDYEQGLRRAQADACEWQRRTQCEERDKKWYCNMMRCATALVSPTSS